MPNDGFPACTITEESREDLTKTIVAYIGSCPSFHEARVKHLLAMLSIINLRYLTTLIEEAIDPDVSEAHWKEKQDNDIQLVGDEDLQTVENDFTLTNATLNDAEIKDDSLSSEIDIESSDTISNVIELGQAGTILLPSSEQDLFSESPDDRSRWNNNYPTNLM